jgi:hypothetical protein
LKSWFEKEEGGLAGESIGRKRKEKKVMGHAE